MSQKKKKDQEIKDKVQQEDTEKVENSSAAETSENEEVADEQEETKAKTEKVSENLEEGEDDADSVSSEEDDTVVEEEEKDPIAEVQKESSEWRDKYMRLSAEFDNYRKRTLKEKTDLIKVANEELLKSILPVVDDFERGMDNIDAAKDIEAMKEGMSHIYKKFSEFLKQNGIKEIEAKEKDFDLDFHEALTKIPAPSDELKGKVVDVIEKGYTLNEKVIRFSKVVVGD